MTLINFCQSSSLLTLKPRVPFPIPGSWPTRGAPSAPTLNLTRVSPSLDSDLISAVKNRVSVATWHLCVPLATPTCLFFLTQPVTSQGHFRPRINIIIPLSLSLLFLPLSNKTSFSSSSSAPIFFSSLSFSFSFSRVFVKPKTFKKGKGIVIWKLCNSLCTFQIRVCRMRWNIHRQIFLKKLGP